MTLWSAAGISMAAAAISTSGGDTAETLKWLVDLCLTGPVDGDMPMIAMEEHRGHPSPTIAMGLGLISAALIAGGLWPGGSDVGDDPVADPDKMLAAMTYVASATGGITPGELADQVMTATGMHLSMDEAALALRTYRDDADERELEWIFAGESRPARDAIVQSALGVGWTHGRFTPGGLEMIGRLARVADLSGDDLALLFWEVTEPPLSARADPFEKLRPKSTILRGETPAPA
ncbi:MAG: hypothetical protein QNJ13_04070 [Paracoccaceae bacterium]|nr:hypothetical protein [Paracoccaceae bacterium]